jgi:tetratricopeptide (TPR) repeat protein
MSLGALAESVHYGKSYLSKIETGHKPAPSDLARRCDALLRAGGELASLAPAAPSRVDSDPADIDGEVWVMAFDADGTGWFRPMRRREALAAGAGSILSFGNGIRGTAAARDEKSLDVFRDLFAQMRRLGQVSSPATMLPLMITQTHAVRDLAARASSRTRDALLVLGAHYAEYTGWMAQESGNDKAALWWTDRAVEIAEVGGDHSLAGYALIRRALVALYREDSAQTVGLARLAQNRTLPPRIREQAARREAQGHALAGDFDACMRSLNESRSQFSSAASPVSPLTLGPTHLPDDPAAMITGWCLYDLGRTSEAAEVLDREIARLAPDAVRSRARYGVRCAMAYAASGEIEHACALTAALLDDVDAVDSATVALELRRLAHLLGRYRAHESVTRLIPRLTESLYRAQPPH